MDSNASPIACGDSDRRPGQTHEHTGDACEFERADQSPLQRLHPEVILDRQRPRDAEQFDARGEREERREHQRHDYGSGVHGDTHFSKSRHQMMTTAE
jgi:hypothetical protein